MCAKKVVRYQNVNGALVKQYESPPLVDGLIDIAQLPVVGVMGAAIIEQGSNANGSWVKWANGTMICTGNGYISFSGSDNYVETICSYPVEFASVSCAMSGQYISCGSGGHSDVYAPNLNALVISISPCRLSTFNTSVNNISIGYLVIGRWK